MYEVVFYWGEVLKVDLLNKCDSFKFRWDKQLGNYQEMISLWSKYVININVMKLGRKILVFV